MKKLFVTVAVAMLVALSATACNSGEKGGESAESSMSSTVEVASVNLTDVMSNINSQYPNQMEDISSTDDLKKYYNIAPEDVKSAAAEIDKSGIEEVVMVEAVDADAVSRIQTSLTQRYNSKKQQGASYSPEDLQVINNCAVEVNGNIVTMIISQNADGMKAVLNGANG